MGYFEGFVVPVPTVHRETYRQHAEDLAPLFREFGVRRMVEAWGDDVPAGKVTDFARAVQATTEETIVFSWFEYPSRAARDAANQRMTTDPRMRDIGATMPFDGKRMIMGGFAAMLDEGPGGTMGYVDGFLVPVPTSQRESYLAFAKTADAIMIEHGAGRVVEAWGDDVPDGKVTDFRRAVNARDDETVVFSWAQWPSKAVRDQGMQAMMADDRLPSAQMPFDGKRMVYGGFQPIVEVQND